MLPLDTTQFSTADAASAAGISLGTLGMQLKRGDIALAPTETAHSRSPGTGRSRTWSARRVLHIALTQELARLGLPIKAASRMALQFSDFGGNEGPARIVGEPADPQFQRMAGQPFSTGLTVLRVLFPAGRGEPVGFVERLDEVTAAPFAAFGLVGSACALVDLNAFYDRTTRLLGVMWSAER